METRGGRQAVRSRNVVAGFLLAAACFLSGCPGPSGRNQDAPRNDPRPTLALTTLGLTTLDKKPVTLERYRGQVVLLDVWASWCPPCIAALPRLEALHGKYHSKGFTVIGVSLDEGGGRAGRTVAVRHKLTYPMLLDTAGSARRVLNVTVLPTLFLLDAQGVIIERWTGQMDEEEIEAAIINALRKPE